MLEDLKKTLTIKERKRKFYLDNHHHLKHVKILRELPKIADERVKNIVRRNDLLRANQLYNARIERQRAIQAFTSTHVDDLPKRAIIRAYTDKIESDITKLAQRGMLPMDLAT